MKKLAVVTLGLLLTISAAGCAQTGNAAETQGIAAEQTKAVETAKEEEQLKLYFNGIEFVMTWEDNAAVRELRNRLADGPITVTTHGYGGWEQVGSLGFTLPTEDTYLNAHSGDVVLYCGSQIVLFYGNNGWDYTPLGHIQGRSTEELKQIMESSKNTVVLSVENPEI